MKNNQRKPVSKFTRFVKKFFLSAFVVITFAAYALHKPFNSAAANVSLITQTPSALVSQPSQTSVPVDPTSTLESQPGITPTDTATVPPVSASPTPPPAASPTPVPPTATPVQAGSVYKNGTFTGPQVDAFYGLVQVQITIQNGKITGVQVPVYPADRRTSAYINSIAVPDLQQETMQVQDPNNMDIISGATLTSQAFITSLQSALSQAKQ